MSVFPFRNLKGFCNVFHIVCNTKHWKLCSQTFHHCSYTEIVLAHWCNSGAQKAHLLKSSSGKSLSITLRNCLRLQNFPLHLTLEVKQHSLWIRQTLTVQYCSIHPPSSPIKFLSHLILVQERVFMHTAACIHFTR